MTAFSPIDFDDVKHWRPVAFSPWYRVGRDGRVYSLERPIRGRFAIRIQRGNFRPFTLNTKGYLRVKLSHQGVDQSFLVHRLVATAFIPNPHALPQVNHKDRDRTNCHVDNLEWVTSSENHRHWREAERALRKGGA